MFYLPHYLWKTFEHKKMDKITSGVRMKTHGQMDMDSKRDSLGNLVDYLSKTSGTHDGYAFKYLFCDISFVTCRTHVIQKRKGKSVLIAKA